MRVIVIKPEDRTVEIECLSEISLDKIYGLLDIHNGSRCVAIAPVDLEAFNKSDKQELSLFVDDEGAIRRETFSKGFFVLGGVTLWGRGCIAASCLETEDFVPVEVDIVKLCRQIYWG